MVGLAVPPYLIARAIDDGLTHGDSTALVLWVAALLGMAVVNAVMGTARHRAMTRIRMAASFQMVRAILKQETRLGAALARRVSSGEVVAVGVADVQTIAQSLTVTGPGIGAVVAYIVVAFLLLSISWVLALVILAGVPLLAFAVGPLLRPLERLSSGYREQQGALTGGLVDMMTGLRVLSGLGGKEAFLDRYRRGSNALREKGYEVGGVTSWIGALAFGLPAIFLAVVTWLSVRMAATHTITTGDLVAVTGYVAMLVVPVASFIEGGTDIARALVSARRVIGFLNLPVDHVDGDDVVGAPAAPAVLRDPVSGVEVHEGRFTALAGARPADGAEIVDRLGRFAQSEATWGDVRLNQVGLTAVRDAILVADNDADIFSGSLREVVAGRHPGSDDQIREALTVAVANDVVDALPDGLDSVVMSNGRNLSGGQRQRLRLARAVHAAPRVLLACEPTSAVDVHTEAAMATRLRAARAGLTTVVTTTSPLVLCQADVVVYLVDGRSAAVGSHQFLLDTEPGYRALVARGAVTEWAR
ncbi:ABC transporter ATP-binding protein [Actinoplanes sp. NPDC051346]|uniref:ABC transporter ATP-binding protein n=1 Tax=Actinoplanes sp. NPDC051346 TaxID=3155048 RepID=UPI0034233C99